MKVTPTKLKGVLLVEPRVFRDDRGYFFESFNAQRYGESGITDLFIQDNVSRSRRGVLRGLHLQNPKAQAKLVSVLVGEVFDVAVDVRPDSPTFRHWVGEVLSAENGLQLYIPPGFAHGFQVLSQGAVFAYKCSDYYNPKAEITIRWNDPDIGVAWPLADASLSDRDAGAAPLHGISADCLPRYR